jgi:hypothetical protein
MARIRLVSGGFVDIKISELRGRRVRTRFDMSNGNTKIPAGTVLRVANTWRSGVSLESPACSSCGVSVYITKIHRDEVELVPEERSSPCEDS